MQARVRAIQVAHGVLGQIHALLDDVQTEERLSLQDLVLLYGLAAPSIGPEHIGACACMCMTSADCPPRLLCNTILSSAKACAKLIASKQLLDI